MDSKYELVLQLDFMIQKSSQGEAVLKVKVLKAARGELQFTVGCAEGVPVVMTSPDAVTNALMDLFDGEIYGDLLQEMLCKIDSFLVEMKVNKLWLCSRPENWLSM